MLHEVLSWAAKGICSLRYRVRTQGLRDIRQRGRERILFLPNHPALIDPILVMSQLLEPFAPRALADRRQIDRFFIRNLADIIDVIPMDDPARLGEARPENIRGALDACIETLQQGDNVLLYPAGHLMHSRYEDLGAGSGVERILRTVPDVRIVLIRTTGLWGSDFSWASGREPDVATTLTRGAGHLLASGLWFMPRREVTLTFAEPDDFPRHGDRNAINRYLEAFYNADAPPRTEVARTLWTSPRVRTLPEPPAPLSAGDVSDVPSATRQAVCEHLRGLTGAEDITPETHLARDLGIDSLTLVDIAAWLQQEFAAQVDNAEALRTAGDLMRAAAGESLAAAPRGLSPVAGKWFSACAVPERVDELVELNVPQAFLRQARRAPGRVILADQISGVRTWRDLLLAVHVLRGPLGELVGERLGLMMPAGVGATVLYLASLFAGKTPALVNWTLGPATLRRCLDDVDVQRVLTSRVLVDRLRGQGVELEEFAERFVFVEDLRAELGLWAKLRAAVKARVGWGELDRAADDAPQHAAILFTSGSEAEPKAVSLTHRNILQNIYDAWECFHIGAGESLLGILPPFHSFGLTSSVILPLAVGLPVAYSPNPTDGAMLAACAEAYRSTLLAGTPTFLHGMVRAARPGQLDSLTLVVSGAEACSEQVYAAVEETCPQTTILEGYGVTECSPIIAVNRQAAPHRRAIGRPLKSFEYVRLNPRTRQPVEPGEAGLLLVRGPCVFDGYLNRPAGAGFVEHAGKTWYDTGDVIYEDEDRLWWFRARLKRFVKIGGEMISLPAVEAVLRDAFGNSEQPGGGLAVINSGSDGAELCLVTTLDVSQKQANKAIREAGLSGLHNIRRVERIDELPLLGNGKIDFRSLEDRIASEE